MYLILSFGYLIVADLKPVMASEKVKVNYGTEEALLAVVDKTKSHKIISWREQCGSLTEALFLQCPRLHEAKGLLHLFDFEPYREDQAKQAQGEGTEQTQSVQGPDPVPPTTGGGPAGPIASSTAERQQGRSSPRPASSPAKPTAEYRLRDDRSLPSREPPRSNYGYPPSRESPPTDSGPFSGVPPRDSYVYPSSRESPPGGQGDYRPQGRRDWPPRLPRSISFDGRTSWHSFLRKFTSYAASCHWSPSECLDVLGWCLEGSASDCFSNLRDMGTESYYPMLTEMGRRFGVTRFPEEAIAEFQTARQLPEESLLAWSDRLQALFHEAFGCDRRGDDTQMVLQLCQGCIDKAAGLTALNKHPKSVEEALEAIRWAQHTQRVVYGSEPRRLYPASRQQVQQTCLYDQEVDSYDTVEEPGIYRHRQPYRSPTVSIGRDVPRPAPVEDRGKVTTPFDTVEEPGIYRHRQPYRSPTVSTGRDVPRPAPVEDRGKVTTPFEVQARNDIGNLKEEVASLKTHAYNTDCILEEILKTVKSLEVSMLSHARPLSPVATDVPENLEGSESEADLRSGNQEAYNR